MLFSLHMLQVNFMLLSNEIKSSHRPSSIFWQSRRRSRLLTACPRSARERERERGVRVCQTGDDRPVWTPFCLMQSRLDELFCSDSAAISREVVCVCVCVCVGVCFPSAWTRSRKVLPLPLAQVWNPLAELKENFTHWFSSVRHRRQLRSSAEVFVVMCPSAVCRTAHAARWKSS